MNRAASNQAVQAVAAVVTSRITGANTYFSVVAAGKKVAATRVMQGGGVAQAGQGDRPAVVANRQTATIACAVDSVCDRCLVRREGRV
eukprot:scaffold62857_cov43-Phaeocystis_antarctica.AAC.2